MGRFRGSDETLDREIAQVERIARLRLARAAVEMRALERDLRELRRERTRRRGESAEPAGGSATAEAVS
ncbi:MAG: hypothetical protein WAK40_04490 [Thermoplasmata archaeon]